MLAPDLEKLMSTGQSFAPAQVCRVPAAESVRLELPTAWLAADAELYNATGRVVRRFRPAATRPGLPRAGLRAGIYARRSPGQPPLRLVFEWATSPLPFFNLNP